MLIQLKTKNFRKLTDRTFTYSAGLNVLRGANEEGKSTMLEAIAYAFFGAKACRQAMEDVVTWGENPKSLAVELTFVVEGTTYTLARSPRGAELTYGNGQSVVGQTEVTAFVGRLFGTAPSNIPNLILSGQGDIRGALDKGPKAATELIEDLANFAIIDDIVTLIGEKLTTGNPAIFEAKVVRLEPEVTLLESQLGAPPDLQVQEGALAAHREALPRLEEHMTKLAAAAGPATAERDQLRMLLVERSRADDRFKLLSQQSADAAAAYGRLKDAPAPEPNLARMEELRGLLADVERLERARSVRDQIAAMPPYDGDQWTSDDAQDPLGTFHIEVNRLKTRSTGVQKLLNELSAQAREKRAQRITASACGLCGKDVSELPEVAAKNAAIEADLATIAAQEQALRAELNELAGDLSAMDRIGAAQTRAEKLVAEFGLLCAVATGSVPWQISYAGPVISEDGRAGALRVELNSLTREQTQRTIWTTKLEQAFAAAERASNAAAEAAVALTQAHYADAEARLPGLDDEVNEINQKYSAAAAQAAETKEAIRALDAEIQQATRTYAEAKARVESVKQQLVEAKADLESVNFNNALLKAVRATRPVIANELWSKVLSTVSHYFSLMRGQESTVGKDADGFKVNGKGIDGLSGSTKDILGLAIRLALVRVFLPHAPFLILDEPSAACDSQRTEAMMGFLVSVGFDQMLVVTHEDTTEQVAASLIEM